MRIREPMPHLVVRELLSLPLPPHANVVTHAANAYTGAFKRHFADMKTVANRIKRYAAARLFDMYARPTNKDEEDAETAVLPPRPDVSDNPLYNIVSALQDKSFKTSSMHPRQVTVLKEIKAALGLPDDVNMTNRWLRRNIHGSIRFCLLTAQTLDAVKVMATEQHAEIEMMPEADRPTLRKGAAKGIRFVPLNDLSRHLALMCGGCVKLVPPRRALFFRLVLSLTASYCCLSAMGTVGGSLPGQWPTMTVPSAARQRYTSSLVRPVHEWFVTVCTEGVVNRVLLGTAPISARPLTFEEVRDRALIPWRAVNTSGIKDTALISTLPEPSFTMTRRVPASTGSTGHTMHVLALASRTDTAHPSVTIDPPNLRTLVSTRLTLKYLRHSASWSTSRPSPLNRSLRMFFSTLMKNMLEMGMCDIVKPALVGSRLKLLKFHTGLRAELVIGGHPVSADKRNLDKPGTIAVLVGTPGRLVDHIGDDKFKAKMGELKMIVLDEADNLDMGFKKPLDVFGASSGRPTPLQRLTLLLKSAVAAFLAASRIGNMTYFSYPLDPADVDSLKSIGLDAPVVTACSVQLTAAQKMPGNT